MKKFLFGVFILLASVAVNAAGISTALNISKLDTAITVADTLGATDSITLMSNFIPEPGWSYALISPTITGTGSDSVAIQIRVQCENSAGDVVYTAYPDSVTAANGQVIDLAFGKLAFGSRYNIRGFTYTGAGTQAIISGDWQIFRGKTVGIEVSTY